jgi:hypothetical protein
MEYYKSQGLMEDPEIIEFFNKVKPNSTLGIPKSSVLIRFNRKLS